MEVSLLTALSATTVILTMSYYWFSSGNKSMGVAYAAAILNGLLCIVVNTMVGSKPGQEGMLLYNISAAWIVIMGAKGLQRIHKERKMMGVSQHPLPGDAEVLGYVDEEGYVPNSTRKVLEEIEEQGEVPPI